MRDTDKKKSKKKRIGEKPEKKGKQILARSKEFDKQLVEFKRKEAEEVAKKITVLFPKCKTRETFEKIVEILTAFQAKTEKPFHKLLEIENQRRIMELQNTRIDDPDWWAKASVATMHGIIIPGMEKKGASCC